MWFYTHRANSESKQSEKVSNNSYINNESNRAENSNTGEWTNRIMSAGAAQNRAANSNQGRFNEVNSSQGRMPQQPANQPSVMQFENQPQMRQMENNNNSQTASSSTYVRRFEQQSPVINQAPVITSRQPFQSQTANQPSMQFDNQMSVLAKTPVNVRRLADNSVKSEYARLITKVRSRHMSAAHSSQRADSSQGRMSAANSSAMARMNGSQNRAAHSSHGQTGGSTARGIFNATKAVERTSEPFIPHINQIRPVERMAEQAIRNYIDTRFTTAAGE